MQSKDKQAGMATNAIIAIIAVLAIIAAGIYYASRPEPTADQKTPDQDEKTMMDDKMPAPSEVEGMEGDKAMKDKSDDTMMEDKGDKMMDGQEMMTPEIKTFNLTGRNFAFSQTEIRVKKGDKVVINFEATEGFHDFTVEGYGVGTKSVAIGQKTSVTFTADTAGTFEYYCSVDSHRATGMVGKLIVE